MLRDALPRARFTRSPASPDLIRTKALTQGQQKRLLRENKPSSEAESLSPVPQQLWLHGKPVPTQQQLESDSSPAPQGIVCTQVPWEAPGKQAPFPPGVAMRLLAGRGMQAAPRQGGGKPGTGHATWGARGRLAQDETGGKQQWHHTELRSTKLRWKQEGCRCPCRAELLLIDLTS